jgi:hypothetical protein
METSSLTLKSMLMTKKVFVPRMNGLSDAQIDNELDRIKETYKFLTPKDMEWIKQYSEPYSDHEGVILTEGGTYPVYPSFDMNRTSFLRNNRGGEVWKFESEK